MALYYDLPVFKDVYKLTHLLFSLTQNFALEYKFMLRQDIKRNCLQLPRSFIGRTNR